MEIVEYDDTDRNPPPCGNIGELCLVLTELVARCSTCGEQHGQRSLLRLMFGRVERPGGAHEQLQGGRFRVRKRAQESHSISKSVNIVMCLSSLIHSHLDDAAVRYCSAAVSRKDTQFLPVPYHLAEGSLWFHKRCVVFLVQFTAPSRYLCLPFNWWPKRCCRQVQDHNYTPPFFVNARMSRGAPCEWCCTYCTSFRTALLVFISTQQRGMVVCIYCT